VPKLIVSLENMARKTTLDSIHLFNVISPSTTCSWIKAFVDSGTTFQSTNQINFVKGIVHFEINFWYVLAYLMGIQDVGIFVSAVVSISVISVINGGLWSPPQRACTEKSKLNMI